MYDELLDRWGLPRPRALTPTPWGWNNKTFFVVSEAGRHVLRVSETATNVEVELEHEILAHLASTPLPFATPLPLVSADGRTIEIFESDRRIRPATLFTLIPGRHPDDDEIDAVAAGAVAFGQLDRVLADLHLIDVGRPMSSDLTRVSAAVPTLAEIERDIGEEAADLVRSAAEAAAPLTANLPRQVIHGDFALGNVLLDGTTVTGILDFELCGPDVRAMELATALGLVLTKGTAERLWKPFVTAYLKAFSLTAAECEALPVLTRVARAAGLIWWVGREREGSSSTTNLAERVQRLQTVESWMSRNADGLVDMMARAG